jgi:V/A-type H+-transporting ATPase subunit A
MSTLTSTAEATVIGVNGNVVTVGAAEGSIMKNEVAYVCVGQQRLKAEVLRILGETADLQVFEETQGVRVGDRVEFTGEMLSATLGPGLLGTIYDGLQNPLEALAAQDGFFLRRGRDIEPLDTQHEWAFAPARRSGERLRAGDTLGTVQERRFSHKIMVPFGQPGEVEVTWIQSGHFTLTPPAVSTPCA